MNNEKKAVLAKTVYNGREPLLWGECSLIQLARYLVAVGFGNIEHTQDVGVRRLWSLISPTVEERHQRVKATWDRMEQTRLLKKISAGQQSLASDLMDIKSAAQSTATATTVSTVKDVCDWFKGR